MKKKDKGIIIGAVVLILFALFFFTPVGNWVKDFANEKSLMGQSIEKPPRDFTLNDPEMDVDLQGFNGAPNINLADLRGEVVFLNFWGSWCPPCIEEMPSIQKLYASHKNSVAFVLIAMQDSPEKFMPFLEDNRYTVPVYEASSLIPKVLIPNVFPTTYIINRQGEVVLKEIKSKDWNSYEVNQLLVDLITE